ncbi:MAG: response regulator transcription factor [Clostridia bacterium]|nr:response regulator transcription factor [Clostridia bacterium]
MFQILVVDDDQNTRRLMDAILRNNGFQPLLCSNGEEAMNMMEIKQVDLIILDIMMPKMDGYEFAEILRVSGSTIPILMVTAKESIDSKKRGFSAGADDYLVKPFNDEELILRVTALLRRAKINTEHKLTVGSTTLYYDSMTVTCGTTTMELPQKEFLVAFKLLSYPNKIFTRRQLMDEIWDMDSESDERTVDVHIGRIRERFADNPDFSIVTIRGLGYKAVLKESTEKKA